MARGDPVTYYKTYDFYGFRTSAAKGGHTSYYKQKTSIDYRISYYRGLL